MNFKEIGAILGAATIAFGLIACGMPEQKVPEAVEGSTDEEPTLQEKLHGTDVIDETVGDTPVKESDAAESASKGASAGQGIFGVDYEEWANEAIWCAALNDISYDGVDFPGNAEDYVHSEIGPDDVFSNSAGPLSAEIGIRINPEDYYELDYDFTDGACYNDYIKISEESALEIIGDEQYIIDAYSVVYEHHRNNGLMERMEDMFDGEYADPEDVVSRSGYANYYVSPNW